MLALALSSALQLIAPAQLAHPPRAAAASDAPPGNILVVVLDDVSAFELGVYGLPGALAQTPTLDALAAEGVLFENVWSAPVCSPTRVSMLTGRYGFRTGIGQNVGKNGLTGPSLDEILMQITYQTDISGGLVGAFRRAKELAGQLRGVWSIDSGRVAELEAMIRKVTRDEVEVVD